MTTISRAAEQRAPDADSFDLGPIHYDLRAYREAPELEPFRELQRRECPDLIGSPIALTTCLMNAMAVAYPHGDPPVEFVNAGYEPSTALDTHMAGAPGHCVTRSGLISATLLASGTPARVVQWFAVGHTMLEVWDGAEWVLFDPTSGVMLTGTPHLAAASTDLEIALEGRSARTVARVPDHGTPAAICFGAPTSGTRVYLDPWLYTRVGAASSRFPYQQAAAVAEPSITIGYGQQAVAVVFVLSLMVGSAGLVYELVARRREPTDEARNLEKTDETAAEI